MNKKRSACLYCGTLLCPRKKYCRCGKAVIRCIADRFQIVELMNIKSGVISLRGWDEVDYCPVFIRVALPTAAISEKEELDIEARLLREMKGNEFFPKHISGGRLAETGGLYTVSEFVLGKTLFDAAVDFSPTKKIELAVQVLKPLQAVHEKNYVVSNVCAENFLYTSDGGVKLINLRAAQPSGERSHGKGMEGYMAPEQYNYFETLTPAADVFGMASLFYKLLTGNFPYPAAADKEELFRAGHGPRKVSSLNSTIIPAIEEVLDKSLELDPNERFANATEMKKTLWDAFTGSTIVDASGITFGRSFMDYLGDIDRKLVDLDSFMDNLVRN